MIAAALVALAAALATEPPDTSGPLPPAPERVRFEGAYGTVTLDHRAHLAARVRCARCHGPGRIGPLLPLDKQLAHYTCVRCHREEARGPTACAGCHARRGGPDAAPQRARAAMRPARPRHGR